MIFRIALVVLLLSAGFPALADDDDYYVYDESLLFLGKLQKTTLYPRDTPFVSETCGMFDEDGEEYCEIIISNSCGTEVIDYEIVESFIGPKGENPLTLKASIGEFCRYNVELTDEERIILALKREDTEGNFDNEYTIYTFKYYSDEDSGGYFFLENPHDFSRCYKLLEIDCYSVLRPVEPDYIWIEEEYELELIKEFQERGMLLKDENNQWYLTKAIFIDDLKSIIAKKRIK